MCYPRRAICAPLPDILRRNSRASQPASHSQPLSRASTLRSRLVFPPAMQSVASNAFQQLRPFAPPRRFWLTRSPTVSPPVVSVFSSTLLPELLRQRLLHYYGLLRHLALPLAASGFPLRAPYRSYNASERKNTRLPRVKRTSCESIHPQTHRRADQIPGFTILRSLAAPAMPNQVHLRYVPLTSLRSSGPIVANGALALGFSSL